VENQTFADRSTADFSLSSRLIRRCRKSRDQSRVLRIVCARLRDIPSVNSLDGITGRICNPSQKYMLTGLAGPAGRRPRRETTIWRRHGLRVGNKKRGEKKTQAYTLRKYFTCASDVLSTVASSRKTNVRRNDPFLAYFLELYAWQRGRDKERFDKTLHHR